MFKVCRIEQGLVLTLLGIAGVIDWKKREIPIWLLVIFSMVVLCFAIFGEEVSVVYRLVGLAFGGVLFVVSKITKEAIGYGDSWIITLMGVHLGIMQVLQLVLIASLLSAAVALFYLWKPGISLLR